MISVVVTRWSDGCVVVRFLFDSLLGVRLIVFRHLERIVNPCGALWRAKSHIAVDRCHVNQLL